MFWVAILVIVLFVLFFGLGFIAHLLWWACVIAVVYLIVHFVLTRSRR